MKVDWLKTTELMQKETKALIVVKHHLLSCVVESTLNHVYLVVKNYFHTHSLFERESAKGSIDQRTAAIASRAYTFYWESTACRARLKVRVAAWTWVSQQLKLCSTKFE